jgi:hypothetical protein
MLKKMLHNNKSIGAWNYEHDGKQGQSIGVFSNEEKFYKTIVTVESVRTENGVVNSIVIDKEKAEKYGFKIIERKI